MGFYELYRQKLDLYSDIIDWKHPLVKELKLPFYVIKGGYVIDCISELNLSRRYFLQDDVNGQINIEKFDEVVVTYRGYEPNLGNLTPYVTLLPEKELTRNPKYKDLVFP